MTDDTRPRVVASDGAHVFHCPGCGYAHAFDQRWTFNGDVVKPTFTPSLLVNGSRQKMGKRCHSFVRDGKIQFLQDCDHALAGQTVDLPPWDDAAPGGDDDVE